MSIHAAANICMAIENFKGRGYAKLGGIILNKRNGCFYILHMVSFVSKLKAKSVFHLHF